MSTSTSLATITPSSPAYLPAEGLRRDVQSRLDVRVVQVERRWSRVCAGRVKLHRLVEGHQILKFLGEQIYSV